MVKMAAKISFINNFWKQMALATAIIVVVAAILFEKWVDIEPVDISTYRQLEASSNPLKREQKEALYSCRQFRNNVAKSLWTAQQDDRRQLRMVCDHSELVLNQSGKKTELVEYLQHVSCYMQEELFNVGSQPMQRIRHFNSQSATFNYKDQRVETEEVELANYTLPGHRLNPSEESVSYSMKGHARSVQFSLKDKNVALHAQHLKATLYPQEGVE